MKRILKSGDYDLMCILTWKCLGTPRINQFVNTQLINQQQINM